MKEYNLDDLNNLHDEMKINGYDYWKVLVIERILENEEINKNLKISENVIDKMVELLMNDDYMWQEIDYAVENVIGNLIGGKE